MVELVTLDRENVYSLSHTHTHTHTVSVCLSLSQSVSVCLSLSLSRNAMQVSAREESQLGYQSESYNTKGMQTRSVFLARAEAEISPEDTHSQSQTDRILDKSQSRDLACILSVVWARASSRPILLAGADMTRAAGSCDCSCKNIVDASSW